MDQRLQAQMKAMESIQSTLQNQLLKFVQEEKAHLEEKRRSMDISSWHIQAQPSVTPLKNKILKSQVGVVSHRHNPHRASVTDLLSGHHSNGIDVFSNAGS